MKIILNLTIFIFCMCCTNVEPVLAKENPKIAALVIQQTRWTKDSFKKAEKRLKKVEFGMPEDQFFHAMDMKVFSDNDNQVITASMDGSIIQLGESIESEKKGHLRAYIFGYVDFSNLAHEKYLVIIKNHKVAEKIVLQDLKSLEKDAFNRSLNSKPSKADYLKAFDYAKNIVPGMWSGQVRNIMHMSGIWSGQNVNRGEVTTSAEGSFFIAGPGYLRDKFLESDSENGLNQQFVFGYEENNQITTGFIIHLDDSQVVNVEYLTQ